MSEFNFRPLSLLNELHHDLDSWFRMPRFRDQHYLSNNADLSNSAISQWVPSVDIEEQKHQFILKAEMAGVDPKNIQIQMEDGTLTIKGEKVIENHQEENNYKRVERQSGKFYRRFLLPDGTADQEIKARSKHGVLEITIPKIKKQQSKTISIEEAE